MELETQQGCPVHTVRQGEVTYNDYLQVENLLKLQKPLSSPPHHDELLFIIIHQAYELWFKLILHEMEKSISYMKEKNVLRSQHFMNRSVQIMKHLVQQIHLLETMSPVDFLAFRDHLMPASGFQSIQFREVEFLAGLKDRQYLRFFKNRPDFVKILEDRLEGPDLRSSYYQLLKELGFKIPENASRLEQEGSEETIELIIQGILPIYQDPSQNLPLYLLSESLTEFDEFLGLWREHHIRAVERVIGFKRGTGGSLGVEYLRSTATRKCFPSLWSVRTYLVKG